MKKNLNRIQHNLYNYMKKKALAYEGSLSKELKSYRSNQIKNSKRDFTASSIKKLKAAAEDSDIIFLGDFHTLDQSGKNVIRILETIFDKDEAAVLCIEFVHQNNQKFIDQYLDSSISEIEFLESIDYSESWKFPWAHYRLFFQRAKEQGYSIVALNTMGTLKERDHNAAEIIVDTLNSNTCRLLVFFGEYHIVENKLPKMVSKVAQDLKVKYTIIHQNLDEVYWKAIENNISTRIVGFSEHEFCLQSSPPWIKYESMIYWYENLNDNPDFDIFDQKLEKWVKSLNSNVYSNFFFICKKICASLGVVLTDSDIEDFNLYGTRKLDYILDEVDKLPKTNLGKFYKYLVESGKTFKIPFCNHYYCSNYSINKLSFLAGSHIQHVILKKQNKDYEDVLVRTNQEGKFVFFAWQCAISFLASKIINPHRKCDLYMDLKEKTKDLKLTSAKRKNIQIAIDVLERKKNISTILKGKSIRSIYFSAKYVGNFLGHVFYSDHFSKNKTPELFITLMIQEKNKHNGIKILMDKLIPVNKLTSYKKRIF